MVFKRRDRRPVLRALVEVFWPKGGWARAAQYVKHRIRRLPDPPERIARGIWAGVFTTFTPFYGLHFIVAALLAFVMRGNILAALLATFFGNPLTYAPIIATSMFTGYWLLGLDASRLRFDDPSPNHAPTVGERFAEAARELWHNGKALFTDERADWSSLGLFYDEVFFPFIIGGILPGVIAGTIAYYLSLPVIRAYQTRRKGALKARLEALKEKAARGKKTVDRSGPAG
ncbi:MAG: DUF2062 domain-containing protein [Marinovum sp.]|nr:DUF2062 domain-containing protein [Marinovum sp.]